MLEARHLYKTYKTKKGVTTKALDDVSVTFAEKGMVFILGKSGSGKSTLLNVCGGLDKVDRGEIVIKGRSSADKGDFDFDSYRNTFVGFVFQEYNILEEFTVEENVALALELQHKKRDKEVIAKILADVDMTEFASRKPNTLSGGQKQRVAIARALVKNPEIIMADEPTGALDSNTGKQVFDTLKKLSRDKLVLIVSHDREFAEQYGDRIIELKDGKIISDMTREEADEADEQKNVRFVGTDTVCVASGAALTDEDFANIKNFLSKSKGQAVITASRDKVDNITRELRGGEFNETAAQPAVRAYSAAEKKMIRSRLPVRHAIRMGASSLKTKPVRLIFTIFLSVIAFLLFGVASTLMLYDADKVTTNAFVKSDYAYIGMTKGYYSEYRSYENGELQYTHREESATMFTLKEFADNWESKYPGAVAAAEMSNGMQIANLEMDNNSAEFFSDSYTGSIINFAVYGKTVTPIAGRLPAADDEVMISDFVFDAIQAGKFSAFTVVNGGVKTGEQINVTSHNDVLDKSIALSSRYGNNGISEWKIVGVFRGENVPEAYQEFQRSAKQKQSYGNSSVKSEWRTERESGLYGCMAVTEQVFASLAETKQENENIDLRSLYFPAYNADLQMSYNYYTFTGEDYREEPREYNLSSVAKYDAQKGLPLYSVAGTAVTSLPADKVAINANRYGEYLSITLHNAVERKAKEEAGDDGNFQNTAIYTEYQQEEREYKNEWGYREYDVYDNYDWVVCEHTRDQWAAWNENYTESPNGETMEWCEDCSCWISRIYDVREESVDSLLSVMQNNKSSEEEIAHALQRVEAFVQKYHLDLSFNPLSVRSMSTNRSETWTVEYVYVGQNNDPNLTGCFYAGDGVYDNYVSSQNTWYYENVSKYKESKDAFIGAVFLPFDKSASMIGGLLDMAGVAAEDDSFVTIGNSLYASLDFVNDMVGSMSKVFLWLGVVLAAFSFLLMFNFISTSISAKKKEIGILRAIGSRTLDVFKIFLAEALIIAVICFVIATVGSWGVCSLINGMMMRESAMFATGLLIFGPLSVLIIAGIALLTSLVATTIPVAIYSRKPPVASIRAL